MQTKECNADINTSRKRLDSFHEYHFRYILIFIYIFNDEEYFNFHISENSNINVERSFESSKIARSQRKEILRNKRLRKSITVYESFG